MASSTDPRREAERLGPPQSLPNIEQLSLDKSNGHPFNVPTEILCTIFVFARDLSLLFETQRSKRTPCEVTSSHVCKSWRTIALNLPQLWNTFRYARRDRDFQHGGMCSLFSAYLERSGTQALDIWLNFRGDYAGARVGKRIQIGYEDTLFEASVAVAARWRRFTILMDSMSGQHTYYHAYLKDTYAPVLEHFAFCPVSDLSLTVPNSVAESYLIPKILSAGAPALKSIRLDSNSFQRHLPPFHDHLTTLRIDRPSHYVSNNTVPLHQFISVLEIPSLRNLSISGINILEDLTNGIHQAPVIMKSLREFRCSSGDVIELFQYIHTPALETVILKNADFPLLPEESISMLTTLVLINCSVPWARLSTELTYISNRITHLIVSEGSGLRSFHNTVVEHFDAKRRWSSLEYLGCNIQKKSELNFYDQFARLRKPYPFTLKVHKNLLDQWENNSPDSLRSLRGICNLEGWDELEPLMPHYWPCEEDEANFGYDRIDYDPFEIISYH